MDTATAMVSSQVRTVGTAGNKLLGHTSTQSKLDGLMIWNNDNKCQQIETQSIVFYHY